MCGAFTKEFRLKNFWLSHSKPEAFCTSQWKWHPVIYIVVRICLALYTFASLLAVCLMARGSYHSIMVFLTIWTYLLLTLHFWIAALIAFYWFFKQNPSSTSCEKLNNKDLEQTTSVNLGYIADGNSSNGVLPHPHTVQINGNAPDSKSQSEADFSSNSEESDGQITWYMKISWCLANMVQVFAITVTLVYFTALFPSMAANGISWDDLNMHALNTILVIFDVMISARPVKLFHFIYPVFYGAAYVTFNAIYWSQDHDNNVLYPILNYSYPGLVVGVTLGLGFIGIPILQLLHFGIYKLRLYIYSQIYGELYI